MLNKNIIGKIKTPLYIRTFNIVTQVIYLVVFNKFIYENQFVIEVETQKLLNKMKGKRYYERLHILKIL
jgi:hypothetical protein